MTIKYNDPFGSRTHAQLKGDGIGKCVMLLSSKIK